MDTSSSIDTKINNINQVKSDSDDVNVSGQSSHQDMVQQRGQEQLDDYNAKFKKYFMIGAPIFVLLIIIIIIIAAVSGGGCPDLQIKNEEGKCESCDPYTRIQKDPESGKLTCGPDKCVDFQYLQENGSCMECQTRKIPSEDKKLCIFPTCPEPVERFFVTEERKCQECGAFQVANFEKVGCQRPLCDKEDRMDEKGNCVPCDIYKHGNWDPKEGDDEGKICTQETCNDKQKMDTSGFCQDCPTGYQASLNGKDCDPPDFCNYNGKLVGSTCEYLCKDDQIYHSENGQDNCLKINEGNIETELSGFTQYKARQGMKYVFSKSPNFANYANTNQVSLLSINSFNNAVSGGTALTDYKFSYGSASKDKIVQTPILQMIDEQYPDEAELLYISQLKLYDNRQDYVDVWILYENDRQGTLTELAGDFNVKCCMNTKNWKAEFTGIVRVLQYNWKDVKAPINQLNQIYEGYIRDTSPEGFGRFINGEEREVFVGYFKYESGVYFAGYETQGGSGLLFFKEKLKYSGVYDEGTKWNEKPPSITDQFTKFKKTPTEQKQ